MTNKFKTENMEIPAECNKCKKLFDIAPILNKYGENEIIKDIMKKEFKNGKLSCKECRE